MGNLSLSTRKSSQVSLPCTIEQICRLASDHPTECPENGSGCLGVLLLKAIQLLDCFWTFRKFQDCKECVRQVQSTITPLNSTASLQLCPGGSHTLSSGRTCKKHLQTLHGIQSISKPFRVHPEAILSLSALLASDYIKISRSCSWCALWLKAKLWLIQSSGFNSSSTSISTDDACRSLQHAFWAAFYWASFRM